MSQEISITLNPSQIRQCSCDDLCHILENAKQDIILEIPGEEGYLYSSLDQAEVFCGALFIGEKIAEFCENIYVKEILSYREPIYFSFQPNNIPGLAKQLAWLFPFCDLDSDDDYHDLLDDLENEYLDFRHNLESRILKFPEIADFYLGNCVEGQQESADNCNNEEEYFRELHSKYPEQIHYFWRSFLSNEIGYDFYVSQKSWIVPLGVDIKELLKRYGGFKNEVPDLEAAEYLSLLNCPPIAFQNKNLIIFPESDVYQAQKCAEYMWFESPECDKIRENMRAKIIQLGIDITTIPFLLNSYINQENRTQIQKILLSIEGDVLIVQDRIAQYVLFPKTLKKIKPEDGEKYLESISKLSESLRTLIGRTTDIACPWDKLDDNQFEELCYDVVNYRHQPSKILKMGKSRSRDGGRDIVFHTTGRAGQPPVKWIVQCKLIRDGSSLAGSKVQVADPVDQYGAGGFCVMTSGVIDSTLYDKLEGVARNRGIEIDWWSRLELERFLARHTELRDRYFGKEMENKKSSHSENVQLSLLDILDNSSSGSS
ncbi:hypothetical protein [Microcoleus sp. D2_18a_D3]|uniref:hypothetical protein n=1 Tax=Microcoleus sp. D2_18a_D3 TaxID=3055330 RepID=UPI002FD2E535